MSFDSYKWPDENLSSEKKNNDNVEQWLLWELKEQLDRIDSIKNYSWKAWKALFDKLWDEDYHDPEAKQTIELLNKYQAQYLDAVNQWNFVEVELKKLSEDLHKIEDKLEYQRWLDMDDAWNISELSVNPDRINSISNIDFLSIPESERLQYITKNHIDVEKLIFWEVSNVEFNFDHDWDGVDNQNLFLLTTAWQVLPETVREIVSDGVSYTRLWLNWEFFDENWIRLKIYTGTKLEISKLWDSSDINELKNKNREKVSNFISENPEYSEKKYKEVINEAIEKWLEPKLFIWVVSRRVETFDQVEFVDLNILESLSTEVSRELSGHKVDLVNWIYDLNLASAILRELTPTTWKENLKDYWYDIDLINQYEKDHPENIRYDIWKVNNYIPAEYSAPVEKSDSWTTLCSRTARLNLSRLWVEWNINRGSSARESFNMYGWDISSFPPNWDTDALVADFYLDASSKNAEYWHRVAAFKDKWSWYILDPYYDIVKWVDNRLPVPAETYISVMESKGRKMWWAHYFS